MFESFDYNQDGIIDAAELSSALNHYKCVLFLPTWLRSISENSCLNNSLQVGPVVVDFLIHKYGALRSSLLRVAVISNVLDRNAP